MPIWNGQHRSYGSLEKEFGISRKTLHFRVNKMGWTLEKALSEPVTRVDLDVPSRENKAYQSWRKAKERCINPDSQAYHRYGGRGITFDSRWNSFHQFIQDMGEPGPGQTLDRIDNNGPYSKENCRWADRQQQARNRRDNVWITAFGRTQTLQAWADETGLGKTCLSRRIKNGWPSEEAVSTVSRKTGRPLTLSPA